MSGTWVSRPDLADCIGADAARTFTRLMGGARVYVPVKPESGHKLEKILGPAAFHALTVAFGGRNICLPNDRERDTAKKRAFVLFCAGYTPDQVAAECRITRRYADSLLHMLRKERSRPTQLSLI